MFKTVTNINADTIFREINDVAVKDLKLLRREAEKLDWSLLLDVDLGQFGLMSADGFIGQYPYMLPSGYQTDTATISMVRNLISLFVEKFQPVSNELKRLQCQNNSLNTELSEAKGSIEYRHSQLEQTIGELREARNENSNLQKQLEAAQAELAKQKEFPNGGAAITEADETA